MLALILDPRFKELTCIIEIISRDRAKILVQKHDRNMLLPILVKVAKYLNPHVAQVPWAQAAHTTKSFFEAHFTSDEAIERLMLSELSIFWWTHVTIDGDFQPLAWWKEHQANFSTISLLPMTGVGMKTLFGWQIPQCHQSNSWNTKKPNQNKKDFLNGWSLCVLRRCRLGIENLDALVMIYNNWPDGLKVLNMYICSALVRFLNN